MDFHLKSTGLELCQYQLGCTRAPRIKFGKLRVDERAERCLERAWTHWVDALTPRSMSSWPDEHRRVSLGLELELALGRIW